MDKKCDRIVILKLNPSLLRTFTLPLPSNVSSSHEGSSNGSPRNSSPIALSGGSPQVGSPSTSESTPVALLGAKPGPKRGRTTGLLVSGKLGRKKQKLELGTFPPVVSSGNGANGNVVPPLHVKLGPKANQGAINAQLRALDRTGNPCKRWTRTGFQLKSFTGVSWSLPCWSTSATTTTAIIIEKNTAVEPMPLLSSPQTPEASNVTASSSSAAASHVPSSHLIDVIQS